VCLRVPWSGDGVQGLAVGSRERRRCPGSGGGFQGAAAVSRVRAGFRERRRCPVSGGGSSREEWWVKGASAGYSGQIKETTRPNV